MHISQYIFLALIAILVLGGLMAAAVEPAPIADVEGSWADEIESRVVACDGGVMQTYPAEQVFVEAKSLSH